ncbi:MAG: glycine oxidase ThiO [Chloroflexi bacterium]|nr:glycine oxidase ThiO [Chloroflexota bacterium]
MIILTVNGESRTVDDGTSIIKLLETLGIEQRRVAVAINGEVVPRTEHEQTSLNDGDQVEIVRMVGGGSLEAGSSKLEAPSGQGPRVSNIEHRMSMQDGADVIVVGAGIVGCAIAYELTRRGASCIVIDSRLVGMAATNAAAGILAPYAEFQRPSTLVSIGLESLTLYPRWVEQLREEVPGIDVEFQLNGVLRVAFNDGEMADLRKGLAYQDETGLELIELDAATIREVEPRLSPEVVGGLLCPDEGQVSNQLFTLALSRAAKQRGARFYERSPVTGFRRSRGRVTTVRTTTGDCACDHLVLAAGPWTRKLAKKLGADVPTRPIRGQMIALGGMSTPIRHVVWGPRGYLLPRANGLVFAGATVEDVGFRFGTTKHGLAQVRRGAFELVPQLRHAREHFSWFGLRPNSPDGLPILGALPGWENVTLATGHFRSGILLAPVTGKLIAEEIVSNKPTDRLTPFRPGRFA